MTTSASDLTEAVARENARLRGDLLTLAQRFSHDLRTPLGGIVSAAEALKEVLAARDPSAIPLADSLLASADEMIQLIKQITFLVRASAQPLPKRRIHMAEAVFSALQCLESRILRQQAVVVEPASWPVISGVPAWLGAIWWHLLANSLNRCPEKGRLEMGWERAGDSIRFWIDDNGTGVPPELRKDLFKEFHVLHEQQNISGLGLSIVQRLVELQGGNCGHEITGQGRDRFFFNLSDAAGSTAGR